MNRGIKPEPYQLVYLKSAERTMRKLPTNIRANIDIKLEALAADPMAANNNVTALQGGSGFRLRVGDRRVTYKLDHGSRCLRIASVRPRGDNYKP